MCVALSVSQSKIKGNGSSSCDGSQYPVLPYAVEAKRYIILENYKQRGTLHWPAQVNYRLSGQSFSNADNSYMSFETISFRWFIMCDNTSV